MVIKAMTKKRIVKQKSVKRAINVALIGNPNVGKSTLFNALTGLHQKIGNWPGVTIEKKVGTCHHNNNKLEIVDLPGTYSLSAYSLDEKIARDFIVNEKPDVVVQVVDASNLERNLYLTLMLVELGCNVVIALNMIDQLEDSGSHIDIKGLAKSLNLPVVPTIASKKMGIDKLLETITSVYNNKKSSKPKPIYYSKDIEREIEKAQKILETIDSLPEKINLRWLALLVVQKDPQLFELLAQCSITEEIKTELSLIGTEENETEIIDAKYKYIEQIVSQILTRKEIKITRSDKVDKVLTHKWLGIPIFLIAMWGAFQFTFIVSAPFMDLIDLFFSWLSEIVAINVKPQWLSSLIGNGIIGGVGFILVFLPPIFAMFFILAILEDSGYLARAAFVMDKFMNKLGLHGRSFIPMLLGFGCNVPAIMATRTLRNRSDRLITILTIPFMSCGARLPVYVLFAGVFFKEFAPTVVFILYLFGILVAIITAIILRKVIFKGKVEPFIMELPPYHIPKLKTAINDMWRRGSVYLKKAGTTIFVGAVMVWLLASLPFQGVEYGTEKTWIGYIGHALEPIFRPLGFDWRFVVAILVGFLAKELVVGALGTLMGVGDNTGDLSSIFLSDPKITALNSLSLMFFTLLYVPCVATIAVIKKETGSWKWTLFSVLYSTAVAWIFSFIVFQVGSLISG
ncbi:MAG: ferrous iron transport protein B [Candidatus Heimdallarchaeaceae archaeon]